MTRSREELVGCLASIADMANTGHGSALPPGAAAHGRAPPAPPEAMLKMNTKLRRRLESLKGTGDDLEMIENLMGLVSIWVVIGWFWQNVDGLCRILMD